MKYSNRAAAHEALDALLDRLEIAGAFEAEATPDSNFDATFEIARFASAVAGVEIVQSAGVAGDNALSWQNRLAERMYGHEFQYRMAKKASLDLDKDPEEQQINATVAATFSVIAIFEALSELPKFAGSVGLLPVQDLIGALGELAKGNQSPMLKHKSGIRKSVASFNTTYVMKHAVAGTEALRAAGCTMTKASAIVAKVFADAGVKGYKKGRLSAGTVQHWAAVLGGDNSIGPQIREFAASWRTQDGQQPKLAEATAWVRRVADSAAFRSKI